MMELSWHVPLASGPRCPRSSFTEQVCPVPAGARFTAALRREAGRTVADNGHTVVQAGCDLGISWLVADTWHIGFVDAVGGQGLLEQVEGSNSASVTACSPHNPKSGNSRSPSRAPAASPRPPSGSPAPDARIWAAPCVEPLERGVGLAGEAGPPAAVGLRS